MAKYTVTRSCGHEETVALIGKTKDREWRLEHVESSKLCFECYQADLQKRREESNREAAEAARINNYQTLTGTENQIPWAETIRQRILTDLDTLIYDSRDNKGKNELAIQEAYQSIRNKKSAHWWIDHRYLKSKFEFKTLLEKEYETLRINQVASPPKEVVVDTLSQATVRPENPITETVAEIRVKENTIEIFFPEKREDFRELVKNDLRMSWDHGWKRELGPRNGAPEDRAVEAGHRLLAAGFIVRIFDEAIRNKAVSGDYEQECTNWVLTRSEGDYIGWLIINWDRKDDFYKVARRLPGSRYSKPSVAVPIEHYEEVLDFAQMYGFKITKMAQKSIDAARVVKEESLIAKVDGPARREREVGMSGCPVLEVPTEVEVADEFKD